MKVLITKSANDSWYYHKVGEIVEVELSDDNFYKYIHDKPWGLFIKVKDCEEIKETIMKLNLRQLAESNITFRFETDDDRAEFWELFIKNRGCTFNNHRSELLNYAKLWEDESGKLYIDNYKYIMGRGLAPTWTEIKEKYMKDKEITEFIEKITPRMEVDIEAMEKIKELNNKHKINQAITLLQSNGYTLTSPYIPPTDEEICERIKAMNEEVGYSPDWSKSSDKYFIYFSTFNNRWEVTTNTLNKVLGVTYTTQSIAKQIVAELNEKRFVRV